MALVTQGFSGEVLIGWEAAGSESPNHGELGRATLTFLKAEQIASRRAGQALTHSGSVANVSERDSSPHRTTQIWSQGHRNGPIVFLEPFCHLEENSVPSYLFKECSRPYLIATNRSRQDIAGCVISWECSL